jgi:hypothetical protein
MSARQIVTGWLQDSIAGARTLLAGDWRNAFLDWRWKRRLRAMLADKKFPGGYRSTQQLQDGIGADAETTMRLLLAIGAYRSPFKDEWTSKSPAESPIPQYNYTLY